MDLWNSLLDVIILLGAALVLGAIFERFRQSAILGYLLAGTLLGPNALHWISNEESVKALAELGVALLLFTIGLEFSWGRLRRMGRTALGGGIAQVIITMVVACGAAYGMGLDIQPALTIGAVIALSSTATVLRILMARSEIESVHGRFALGILLVQDMAVVPLVIMVSLMSGSGAGGSASGNILLMILLGVVLLSGFYLLFNYIVPAVLGTHMMLSNRGSRYSFGYPACPELSDQEKLFRLLQPQRIGCILTDNWQIDPEQSTSAIVVHHPEAKYFNV